MKTRLLNIFQRVTNMAAIKPPLCSDVSEMFRNISILPVSVVSMESLELLYQKLLVIKNSIDIKLNVIFRINQHKK